MHLVFPYPDITLVMVIEALEAVNDVEGLDTSLGIPLSIRHKIKEEHESPEERKKAVINYWLLYVPNASWSTLAGSLWYLKKEKALEKVQRYIQKAAGK